MVKCLGTSGWFIGTFWSTCSEDKSACTSIAVCLWPLWHRPHLATHSWNWRDLWGFWFKIVSMFSIKCAAIVLVFYFTVVAVFNNMEHFKFDLKKPMYWIVWLHCTFAFVFVRLLLQTVILLHTLCTGKNLCFWLLSLRYVFTISILP